jgi:PFU (PLAA family ubiquitin binding)
MPGKSDNETIFVRDDGKLWAHAWSSSACEWHTLGEVTAGPSDNTVEAPKKVRCMLAS